MTIKLKLVLAFFALALIPRLITGVIIGRTAQTEFREEAFSQSEILLDREVAKVNAFLERYRLLTRGLGDLPSLQQIVATEDEDAESHTEWQARLGALFASVTSYNVDINTIRYIDNQGKEVVRVDAVAGELGEIMVNSQLKDASSSYYVQIGSALSRGDVYISPLDLNLDSGQIQEPHLPTIRFVTPVFDSNDHRQGMIVLNLNAEPLLTSLAGNPDQDVVMIDQDGYFLYHADPSKRFGFQLNHMSNYFDQQPELQQNLQRQDARLHYDDAEKELRIWQKIFYNPDDREEYWVLLFKQPEAQVFAHFSGLRNFYLISFSMMPIVLLVVLWLFHQWLLLPLSRLEKSIKQVEEGDYDTELPVPSRSKDEIGKLAIAFERLRQSLKRSQSSAEKTVVQQTAQIKEQNQNLEKQQRAIMNVMEDMEAEKAKIEHQAQELQKFKLAVQGASDAIVITDPDGIVMYANPAVEQITGFSVDNAVGRKAGVLWGKEMSQTFYQELWHTIKTKKEPFSSEIKNHRKSGEKFTAHISITPLLDAAGEVKFFVSVSRDITKEKEVDRMKTEFISLASHQLRTPLSAMKWFLEMLLNGDAGPLTPEQTEMVSNVNESNQRMISLVNGLLNISRIESGRIIVDPKPTQVGSLVQEVLKEFGPQIEREKLQIVFSVHPELGEIMVDPDLAREVYRNLISNAVKYSPEGSEITILISRDDDYVTSQVSDQGVGIPEKDQPHIFEKFHRGENVVKTETDGTGLGLYLTKAIVDSSGGKLWFESQEGKGTTFWFTFPVAGVQPKKGEVRLGESEAGTTEKPQQGDQHESAQEDNSSS